MVGDVSPWPLRVKDIQSTGGNRMERLRERDSASLNDGEGGSH